ncbi:hypothetical protein Bca101_094261 [Brassica carinata]
MNIIITVTIILILILHLEYLEVELIDSTNKSQCIDGFKRFKIIYHGPTSSRRLPLLLKLKITNLVTRVLYLGV